MQWSIFIFKLIYSCQLIPTTSGTHHHMWHIMIELSELITEMLRKEYAEKLFPKTLEEFKTATIDMESKWQFHFAFLTVGCSQLPIKCPNGGGEAMKRNSNFNFFSTRLLALVKTRYQITWVSVEDPGNTHDSIYFQYTYLWNKTETRLVFPDQVQVEDDFKIPQQYQEIEYFH